MTQSEQRRVLAEYVAGLRALCAEVSAATSALSRNDISDLETRLEAQQSICQQLTRLAPVLEGPASDSPIDKQDQTVLSSLKQQLHQEQQELARVSGIFGSLVKRSAKTVSWLSLLCQSYAEGYGKRTSAPTASRLSCEV